MEQALWLEWLGHADDSPKLMACGIISGLGRAGEQDYWNVLQPVVPLDDKAKIMAGHIFSFYFRKKH
jgi:hypothetical protein